MRVLREWVHRVLGTLSRRRRDEELQQELRTHLQLAAEDAQRRGETPATVVALLPCDPTIPVNDRNAVRVSEGCPFEETQGG